MAKKTFKYRINELIGALPRQISILDLIRELEKHGINRATFYRDRALTIKSDFSISSDRLDIYAALFGVSPDQLKNYQPKKVKTISDMVKSPKS